MNDLDLVQASADCYDQNASWERVWNTDNIWMFYRNGILAFRGSKSPQDWIRDLEAIPSYQAGFGFVQSGFMEGMEAALQEWQKDYPDVPAWLTGHSLGGAHAAIMAAMLISGNHINPNGLVTFGSPRPGFYKLRRVLRSGQFPMRAYANDGDPVPILPPHVAWIFPYIHPEREITVHAGASDGDTSPFAAHHISRYVEAIQGIS